MDKLAPVEITPAKALFFIANNFGADNVDIVFRNGASTIVTMFGLLGVNPKSVTPEDRNEANRMAAAHGRKGPHPDNPFVPDAWRWANSRTKGLLQRSITLIDPTRQSPGDKKMPSLKVPIKQAAKLLEQLGYLNVRQMKASAVLLALTKLDETADATAEAKVTDEASLELLKKVKVTIAKGEDITLTNEGDAGTAAAKKPVTDDKRSSHREESDDDEEDDEDAGSDDDEDGDVGDEEEEEAKPAKKPPVKETKPSKPAAKPAKPSQPSKRPTEPLKPQKSAGAKPGAATSKPKPKEEPARKKGTAQKSKPGPKVVKGPKMPRTGKNGRNGVYAVIVAELQKASPKRPATEDGIMKVLKVKCKDRKAESMLTSLKDALRRTIKARYKLPVKTNDKGGWWIEKLPA